ncbi:thiopeptide-type bacteriocin biosynthesis protein [Streptomyces olivaceus]|uniref:thiopeptide-type bacteriocin biosynthesis protein n=1 Tax=Streptomyces olivaceus TaxID=47716 RepID=UPI001CCF736D|nr:thiopeptide-type bacteriocin biosynthesis protein [Streptomyces olivaceus]MBZ6205522.1 thiopeptide-type bacteriocin biosynthesis protein [Streptomyces olivaceus]
MEQQTAPGTPTTDTGTTWSAWHLHVASNAPSLLDRVVNRVVAPVTRTLDGAPWFFIRYWEGGPHLRLRVGDLGHAEHARVEALLRDLLAAEGRPAGDEQPFGEEAYRAAAGQLARAEYGGDHPVAELRPPGVHRALYEPETARYGGAALMPRTERLFQRSSELVLALLPHVSTPQTRSALALRATVSAAAALGDDAEQALYYTHSLAAWRAWAAGLGSTPGELDRLCHIPEGSARPVDPDRHGPFEPWHAALTELVREVRATTDSVPGQIVVSHVHMFHNRLGRTLFDELRTYAWLERAFPARGVRT